MHNLTQGLMNFSAKGLSALFEIDGGMDRKRNTQTGENAEIYPDKDLGIQVRAWKDSSTCFF